MSASEESFVSHLLELRHRLIWIFAGWIGCFLILTPWARELYTWLATPLLAVLPVKSQMISTELVASFMVPMKVALMIAGVITLPNTFYQLWAFIAPGLYQTEKRLIFPLVFGAVMLFFIGMTFAYRVIAPVMFYFFSHYSTPGVTLMPDMEHYLSLMISLLMTFGATFEVPIVVLILVRVGLVSRAKLKEVRPYVILAAFIVAAVLTPPDVLSQCLLAIPLCGLYELGIFTSRWFEPKEEQALVARTETIKHTEK